ncbi:MAG: hypothetical protein AB1626_02040 [Candidatus Micrarchaeota archaeon]
MPFDDVRRFLWQRVNDYRIGLGLPSLEFHEEQSRGCKQHVVYLASASRQKNQLLVEPSPESMRRGWQENVAGVVEGDFDKAVDVLLWKNLSKPEFAEKIRGAQAYFAADMGYDPDSNRVFLVMRFK